MCVGVCVRTQGNQPRLLIMLFTAPIANKLCLIELVIIRESVDSLCRDGADMPRPPYIGKACTRPNLEDLSLFRYLTIVYESLCTQQHSQIA